MVSFYVEPKRRSFDRKAFELKCDGLDLHCRGVGRARDAVWFVEGLLPGETARVQPLSQKGSSGEASIIKIIEASPKRVTPACDKSELCGGCPLAHIEQHQALEAKAEGVRRLLARQTKLELGAPDFLECGNALGYRRACRFALRFDRGVLKMGFRAAGSKEICNIDCCEVLTARINSSLETIYNTLADLKCRGKMGHLEVLDSDGALGLSLRLTVKLTAEDEAKLQELSAQLSAVISVQEPYVEKLGTDRTEKIKERVIAGDPETLYLKAHDIKIRCLPTSFAQVNADMNAAMIAHVLKEIEPKEGMRVLDLFCGLGNFTLPIAATGAACSGVDIVPAMVKMATENAARENIPTAHFATADLEAPFESMVFAKDGYEAVVMDPGRSGARRASTYVASRKIPKVVMISCNPLAASRDLEAFMKAGYKVSRWGLFDMFPKTTHVEMMLVLER